MSNAMRHFDRTRVKKGASARGIARALKKSSTDAALMAASALQASAHGAKNIGAFTGMVMAWGTRLIVSLHSMGPFMICELPDKKKRKHVAPSRIGPVVAYAQTLEAAKKIAVRPKTKKRC